jgi:hypothetical protein
VRRPSEVISGGGGDGVDPIALLAGKIIVAARDIITKRTLSY